MDRHEYEINQLINPKKDIVKSNSKHRDNLETLILGRRIGGIVGGGEPPKNILEDGKYRFGIAPNTWLAGEFSNGVLSVLGQNYPEYQIVNQVVQFNDGGRKLSNTDSGIVESAVVPRMEAFDNYSSWVILNFGETSIDMAEYSQLPNS